MLEFGHGLAAGLKALGDVVAAQRAVGADVVGLAAVLHGGHGFDHGLANLHGVSMGGFFHAIGASMPRAALDGVDGGVGNHLEHFFGFLADVLHPTMAGNLVADVAQAL